MQFEMILAVVALGLIVFQFWLTRRVFRSDLYDPKQKMLQAQLIWLLPIVGAGLVFSVLRQEEKAVAKADLSAAIDRNGSSSDINRFV